MAGRMSRVLRSVASLGVGVGLAVTTACGGAPAPPRPRTALYRAPSVTTEPAPRAPRAPVEGVSWAADEPEAAFVALERQAHALFARPHPLRLA
ncbi:MAG TPA: hypothetical protein VFZ83_11495, partial [Acidimicrobiia bacterium]|nr:hypothetical protein [Acidimicrobiia bacterium]